MDAGSCGMRAKALLPVAGLVGAALALLWLRIDAAFSLAMNSDEPQHLHVVWAWTQGLLPYRDVFDNHAPLFHWLSAPLLNDLGERADILPLMRLAMIPLYCGALAATWWIGRVLWSPRVGLYAAGLSSVAPLFFVVSAQFRPDDLWMLCWLGAVATAVTSPFGARRAFLAGVLVGAALAASLKTTLLIGTAGIAAATVWILRCVAGDRAAPRHLRLLAPALAGATLVPAAFALYFIAAGAGPAAAYCLFAHNLVRGLGHWSESGVRLLLFPVLYPLAVRLAWRARRHPDQARWWRRSWVLLSAVAYVLALYSYWPLLTRQDMLPVLPLVVLALAAWLLAEPRSAPPRMRVAIAMALLATAIIAVLVRTGTERDGLRFAQDRLARVLALTRAGDHVMDAKGESIFRPRPIYWVLEDVTRHRIQDGSMIDDIPARLAATATPLVIGDRLPARDAAFVAANYLPIGANLYVAGRRLGRLEAGEAMQFEITIPGTYSAVTPDGAAMGTLDGTAGANARPLDAGTHTFVAATDAAVALVWTPALARGVAPKSLFVEMGQL